MADDPWKIVSEAPAAKEWEVVSRAPIPIGWSEVPGASLRSLPSSAKHFAGGLYEAVTSPVKTITGALDVGAGALRAAAPRGVQKFIERFDSPETTQRITAAASAAGGMLADRYGSVDALRRTLATDPVGAMSDLSTLFTGGGAAVSRVPGMAAAGGALSTAGAAVDPLMLSIRAGSAAGRHIVPPVLGFTTGAGSESVRQAYTAGREGGAAGDAFTSQMRGTQPVNAVVDSARAAVEQMRQERSVAYQQGMGGVRANQAVLPFAPIEQAVMQVRDRGRFHGVEKNPAAAGMWDEIGAKVAEWRAQNPAVFHTAEGLDALKQAIGNIRDGAAPGSPAANVADQVYHTIRQQIVAAAPDYARVMGDYETASAMLREMEQSLSINPRANVDTTVRKLQSILRNNANTNYGRRVELGRELEAAGAQTLFPQLAGQAMSSATPRSLQGIGSAVGVGAQALTSPGYMAGLALTSPRLVGEGAYAAGRGTALADALMGYARQRGVDPRAAANIAYQLQQMQGAQ